MLNGLNQVKAFEQSLNGVNDRHFYTAKPVRSWLGTPCIFTVSDRMHLRICMRKHLPELVRNTSSSHHVKSDTGPLLVV